MNPSPPDTNRSVFLAWCTRIDLAIAPFMLIMITTVWAIISTASQAKIEPVAEIQEQPFICPCAKPFGQLQAHLDCHEALDEKGQ